MMRIPVLMYHSIDDSSAPACVKIRRFDEQMSYLKRSGYQAVHLDAVYEYLLQGASLPAKPVVITFDDGYRDNMLNAYPILKKYWMCFTIFLATDYIGSSNRWNASEGVVQRVILTWEEANDLAKDPLVSLQAHTCSHPRLTKIPMNRVREELIKSKQIIEDRLGRPCNHFAYPYGDFNDFVRNEVQGAGFHTACSTFWGHIRSGDDSFSLNRIGLRNQDNLSAFKRVLGEPPSLMECYWLRIKSILESK
jgi:peptidoglycan/xylan/chitin deacetylase (PgdA/CDA1 family)